MDGMHDKIAQKAFSIYKERGNKPGSDYDDWLRAEKEIITNLKQRTQEKGGLRKIK
jgi:hypothetical protein